MKLIEVNSPEMAKQFLTFPVKLYQNDSNYIRPLDQDIEAIFDVNKNKRFRKGELTRYLLEDSTGIIGRIAAFVDPKSIMPKKISAGGLGFFECINDQKAANMLFDKSKAWLQERGKQAMDGPINFGERNEWWGLMVDGFSPPTYKMNYNPTYYIDLFENYGFQTYFKQFVYKRNLHEELPKKFQARAHRIINNPDYRFEQLDLKNLDKYIDAFQTIYNQAWGDSHKGFEPMSRKQVALMMKSMRPILDPDIICFCYYKDEPVAFFLNLPEINQIVKHFNGNLNWWNKLRFAYHLWRNTCNSMLGVIFGIIPEHQNKGLETALIMAVADIVITGSKKQYKHIELIWIGDFNQAMNHICAKLDLKPRKTYITYRKLFDESVPFERHPML